MSTLTPNYDFILPGVGDPTDQDLWGGYLNANWSSLDTLLETLQTAVDALQLPVGSLYLNADDNTNPGTLLGYGTWAAYAQGRVLVGVGTGTDENAVNKTVAAEEEYGEYEHKQATNEVGSHTHDQYTTLVNIGIGAGVNDLARSTSTALSNLRSPGVTENRSDASVSPMDWSQPSIGVYIWKRTA